MICKSITFQFLSALFLTAFTSVGAVAQNVVDPSEIKEALVKISIDAQDSLKNYQNPTTRDDIKRAEMLKRLDSMAVVYQDETKLVELFKSFNAAYEKVPPQLKFKFKGDNRKNWINYQTACAISGGKWGPSIIDENKKPVLFPAKNDNSAYYTELSMEVSQAVDKKRRESQGGPLKVLLSFPADGAYNMYRWELNGDFWGYFQLNNPVVDDKPAAKRTLATRWTSNNGHVVYSYADQSYSAQVNFMVPSKQLIPGAIYKLELLWIEDFSGLRPYWNASCFGGTQLYNFDPASFSAKWVGVSEPLCAIYFRMSEFDSAYKKMYKKKGNYDAAKHKYSLVLEEPLDSFEIYGSGMIPARLKVLDMLSSSNFDIIYRAVVANYFVTPRTGPVDTVNVNEPHPFEQAGLYNQEFVYKPDESRKAIAKISQEENSVLRNGYTIHGTAGKLKPIVSHTGRMPPRITKDHFSGKVPVQKSSPFTLVVESPKFDALNKQYQEVRQLLQRRVKERALFFYCMEVRACRREGKRCTKSPADFEKTENDNLPQTIKTILATPAITESTPGQKVSLYGVVYTIPGSGRHAADFSFDLE